MYFDPAGLHNMYHAVHIGFGVLTKLVPNSYYYDVMHISGMSKLDSNATLAWNINRNMTKWGDIPVGPAGINYGVIAPAEMASGNLYFDDEDHNN